MVVFGVDIPDFLLVKGLVLVAIAAAVGAYEGWTGKKLFRREAPPAPGPEVKHMGMVDEVKAAELPPTQR